MPPLIHRLQMVGLLLSFATSLIAALATTADFSAWARYALAVLPLVSSLTTSVLSQIRFYDLWKLREEGWFQDLSRSKPSE